MIFFSVDVPSGVGKGPSHFSLDFRASGSGGPRGPDRGIMQGKEPSAAREDIRESLLDALEEQPCEVLQRTALRTVKAVAQLAYAQRRAQNSTNQSETFRLCEKLHEFYTLKCRSNYLT